MGEVSVKILVSANYNWNECLYNLNAAESLVIVHEGEVLRKFTRVLEALLTIGILLGGIDCFAFRLCELSKVCVAWCESKRWSCVEGLCTNVDEDVSRGNEKPGLGIGCWKKWKGRKWKWG